MNDLGALGVREEPPSNLDDGLNAGDVAFAVFMAAAREFHRVHFPHLNMRECDWAAFEERNRRRRSRLRPGAQSLEIEVRHSNRDVAWEPLNLGNGRPLESKRNFSDRYHDAAADASAMGGKYSGKGKNRA